jgi:hypothetical protein
VYIFHFLSSSVRISFTGALLSVTFPSAEELTLYSLRSFLLFQSLKDKGSTGIDVRQFPRGVLIVRGSIGWTRKVFKQ